MFALPGAFEDSSHNRLAHILDTRVFFGPDWHLVSYKILDFCRQRLKIGAGGAPTPRTG